MICLDLNFLLQCFLAIDVIDWMVQDALSCYERRDSRLDWTGLVNCYLAIDQPGTAASLAAGLASSSPDLAAGLAPLQAEAAWQLGNWQEVEQHCDRGGSGAGQAEATWQLGLGRLLLSLQRGQASRVTGQLAQLRAELVEPLSAASLEQGAYSRGYTAITRLRLASPRSGLVLSWQSGAKKTQ